MSRTPLKPGEGQFAPDQITTPVPPSEAESAATGLLRHPHATPVGESYLSNVLRIWPGGADGQAFDVVPDPGSDRPSDAPSALFADEATVYFLPGTHAFGRLTTRHDDIVSRWALEDWFDGHSWCRAVATSPDRQWVEEGLRVRGVSLGTVQRAGRRNGQDVALRWDADGWSPIPLREGVFVAGTVPVRVGPAATGCPFRRGADGPCKVGGGPWTSSSISAALIWKKHRELLLDAFGCDVCEGVDVSGARGTVQLFTPSRAGGWQWGQLLGHVEP